jgi:hypothetical protein
MGYMLAAFEHKILEMRHHIEKRGLSARFRFNEDDAEWVVTLKKGTRELTTRLKTDADEHMGSAYCEDFGRQIREIIRDF